MDSGGPPDLWRVDRGDGGEVCRQHPQKLCQRSVSHLHGHWGHATVWAVPFHLLPLWCDGGAAFSVHVWQVNPLRLWRF